jgi:hypothetical protein
MRSNGHKGENECWSFNVAINVAINISINVGVAINSKGGDCWTIGLDSYLSLMSTLGEVRNP